MIFIIKQRRTWLYLAWMVIAFNSLHISLQIDPTFVQAITRVEYTKANIFSGDDDDDEKVILIVVIVIWIIIIVVVVKKNTNKISSNNNSDMRSKMWW